MRVIVGVFIVLLLNQAAFAEGLVSVPWDEFKNLYEEKIERKIKDNKTEEIKAPFTYSIDSVDYNIRLTDGKANGSVRLSGSILSGNPEAMPLFDDKVIVTKIESITGGHLIAHDADTKGLRFLPAQDTATFQIQLKFARSLDEKSNIQALAMTIPTAVQNTLTLELPDKSRLIEAPGIADETGRFHFFARDILRVRFAPEQRMVSDSIDVDSLTEIRIQGRQLTMTSWFAPATPLLGPIRIRLPENAAFLASSLPAASIRELPENTLELSPSGNADTGFWLRFSMGEVDEKGVFAVSLPRVVDNIGSEGNFIVVEPDNGQITLEGEGVITRIPLAKLPEGLRSLHAEQSHFQRLRLDAVCRLVFSEFQTTAAPAIVLESVHLFTAFEENGNVLSMLVMNIPPEAGTRLRIPAIQGSNIWSLRVNGKRQNVYNDDSGNWIVPLQAGETSRVELALLRKSEALGLHGRLELKMPGIALSAKKFCLAVAIPQRVDLVSIEGPVSSDDGNKWEKPSEFVGKPYYFSRYFYQGESLNIALGYKEPVE